MSTLPLTDDAIIAATTRWLSEVVIGLNLCPFANAVHIKNQIRMIVLHAKNIDVAADALSDELIFLDQTDASKIETTLLILPTLFDDFEGFNDFLAVADDVLATDGYEGVFQVASFHPHYQFADADHDDVSNFTNRAPFAILHILREDSVTRAVDAYPDIDSIYARNIETMRALSAEKLRALFPNAQSH